MRTKTWTEILTGFLDKTSLWVLGVAVGAYLVSRQEQEAELVMIWGGVAAIILLIFSMAIDALGSKHGG